MITRTVPPWLRGGVHLIRVTLTQPHHSEVFAKGWEDSQVVSNYFSPSFAGFFSRPVAIAYEESGYNTED